MRQWAFSVAFMFFCFVFGTHASIRFEHLSNKEGLSQQTVLSIIQDSEGFLWFGTSDGLNRFDGYGFKIYRHEDGKAGSISGSYITAIFEDSQKQMWIGTNNSGLNFFDRDIEQFKAIDKDSSFDRTTNRIRITAIFQDSAGKLWVGTDAGLAYINNESDKLSKYKLKSEAHALPFETTEVTAINQDLNGNLWIGTKTNGVFTVDQSTGKTVNYAHDVKIPGGLTSNKVTRIFTSASGDMWIGTERGLNHFVVQEKQFVSTKIFAKSQFNFDSRHVNDIFEDNQGNIWIGTRDGLAKYDYANKKTEFFTQQEGNSTSLSSNDVRALYTDREGSLWVGTLAGGVDKITPHQAQFNHVKKADLGLAHNVVSSFQLDNEGNLWIGSDGGGISKYDPKTKTYSYFTHEESNPDSLSHDRVLSIFKDSQGNMWIGTWGGGLNKYDANSNRFQHFVNEKNDEQSLSNNSVISILEGKDDSLWLGTWGGGLEHFDIQTGNFKHFRHNAKDSKSLSSDIVWSLLKDHQGGIWVGTFGGGVDYLNVQTEQFTHLKHNPNSKNSLSNDVVLSIFEDDSKNIWIGTQSGLNKYQPKTKDFRSYTTQDGLPNNTIYGILEESNNYLWLSTNKGLSRFETDKEKFKNYNEQDGLQSDEFNANAYYKSPQGIMYFGGVNGFNQFNPLAIQDDLVRPKTVLTDFLLLNKSVEISIKGGVKSKEKIAPTIDKSINEIGHLTLGYKENLITFEFAGLNFSDPMNNQYAYKLENWDKDWIYTDSQNRRATFTNIPAGEYVLRVKASNSDGYWDEQGKSLPITILPAPWLTWWAYTLYVLVFFVALGLFVRHERNKRKETQEINERLTKVDRLKDQFLANTSHELRTPLNGIIGLSELFLSEPEQLDDAESLQYVKSINQCGHQLKYLVDDLLDFSQLRSAEYTLNRSQFDIIELAKQAIELLKPTAKERKIVLVKNAEQTKLFVFADKNRIRQVLYNLINNAIKFSSEDSIQVAIEQDGAFATISVIDKGIGIAKDNQDEIFNSFIQVDGSSARNVGGFGLGLAICKNIIEQHGSKLWLKSKIAQGSQFGFSLKLDKSEG